MSYSSHRSDQSSPIPTPLYHLNWEQFTFLIQTETESVQETMRNAPTDIPEFEDVTVMEAKFGWNPSYTLKNIKKKVGK